MGCTDHVIRTAAGIGLQWVLDPTWDYDVPDPDPRTCEYLHFDHSTEQLGRSYGYNCFGFTWLARRCWIASHTDADLILRDNCVPVTEGSLRLGDIIRYRNDEYVTTHTGRVWKVDSQGRCIKVRSKWGPRGEYIHDPIPPDLPVSYGTNIDYFRQIAPLVHISDLWIRSSPRDRGEQYNSPFWLSPDIIPEPAEGGIRLQTVVHNRRDMPAENVKVGYYWAEPSVGIAPGQWQLVPGVSDHPNPTDAFEVPAESSVEAPEVIFTPPSGGAHPCLMAIAYVTDDYKDSDNPDPIIYPFDDRWDNNIASRNVHVMELAVGQTKEFEIKIGIPSHTIGIPYNQVVETMADFQIYLTTITDPFAHFPWFPTFPPNVSFSINGKKPYIPLSVNDPRSRYPYRKDIPYLPGHPRGELKLASYRIKRLALTILEPSSLSFKITGQGEDDQRLHRDRTFYLHIQQEIDGDITGGYSAVIMVRKV